MGDQRTFIDTQRNRWCWRFDASDDPSLHSESQAALNGSAYPSVSHSQRCGDVARKVECPSLLMVFLLRDTPTEVNRYELKFGRNRLSRQFHTHPEPDGGEIFFGSDLKAEFLKSRETVRLQFFTQLSAVATEFLQECRRLV